MQPSGTSKWSGQVYNDDNGRTYSGNLIELGCVYRKAKSEHIGDEVRPEHSGDGVRQGFGVN